MISTQRIHQQRAAISRVFRCVGWLLLMIFIGRVALVTVYGYAGVPKFNVSTTSGSTEQQSDDKKDENKYTENQFKCIAQDSFLLHVAIYVFLDKPLYTFKTDIAPSHPLTVLTPPPNC
jgi:hypothetical protein